MKQKELWQRANDCGSDIETAVDDTRRETFRKIQDLWINLANESPFLPADFVDDESARLAGIHDSLRRTNVMLQ